MTVAPERGAGVPAGRDRAERLPGARVALRRGADPVVAVLPQWLVARAAVLSALGLAHLFVTRTHPAGAAARTVHEGLLSWDAGWYQAIARVGYVPLGHQSLRFFPLFPLVGRYLADALGLGDGAVLVAVANVAALAGTALLYVLVRRELGEVVARRATWLLVLAPPAFTYVMGYAEGLLLVLSVATFLALRPPPGRAPAFGWAALFGLLAALTRPLGVLLVLPAAVEAARRWRSLSPAQRAAALAAAAGPVAGVVAFLGWAAAAVGDFWAPLRVQTQAGHHGGLSDPLRTLWHDARGVFHHHFGTALHVPWVVLVLALLVVCWQRLPAAYGAFATGVVLVALSGTNLDSFERYALSGFPLVMAAASLTAGPRVERAVLALASAGLAAYALLAFLGLSVP